MGTGKQGGLSVNYTAIALRELDEIWAWNCGRYGPSHANEYIAFFKRNIDALALKPERGKRLELPLDARYFRIREKSRGHGHVAVYSVNEATLTVHHVFHTAQDWQNRID